MYNSYFILSLGGSCVTGEREQCTFDNAFGVGGSCVAGEGDQCAIDRAFRGWEGVV